MTDTNDNTQALPPGTALEEFEILRVLGAGGFGVTYLAKDTRLGREVVIKENLPVQFCFRDTRSLTVAPRHSRGEDLENFQWSLDNFAREAAMLAGLDHPGIVRVLRSFGAFGTAYFVMPFVQGEDLDALARRVQKRGETFAREEVLALFDQMLDALAYLHAQAIYHRDIKPANILVTAEGRPVLIDFGAARQRLGEKSLTVVESAGYTPFEQLQSRGNIGPWSDLYALGATVYKLLTREAPPKAMDRMPEDSYQTLTGREDLLGLYGPEILGSIDRALAVRVADRWQSAEEWRSALAGNPVQVTREGLSYSPPPLPPPLPAVTPPPPPQYGFPAGPPPLPSSTGDAKKENPLAVGWQFVRNELGQARQPLPNRAESICSVILPGLGQLVQGRVATGIGHFFAALFVWGITIGFGGWVVHLWSCGEASLWPGRPPVGGA